MAFLTFTAVACVHADEDLSFKKHDINPDSAFETCGVGDINRDGRLDIMCGDTWYEATGDPASPWKSRHVCDIKAEGGYYHDFSNELEDVNGDGRLDVVSCTWHTESVLWREQPESLDQAWISHNVDKIGNVEVGFHVDINGDGLLDFHPHVSGKVVWYERLKTSKDDTYWKRHIVGERKGYGEGTGDMDGDGDMDIVASEGWFEQPNDSPDSQWIWHPEFQLGAEASDPILVHDFTGDGLVDIVWGMGHNYGIYWLEQGRDPEGKRTWLRHTIDETWSQAHCLQLADFNGDGVMEFATGKRYFAHNGNDPGANDPIMVCIYSWNSVEKSFERYILDQGSRTGFGLRAVVSDLDKDGDPDIICPGKSGLYWFENRRQH